jgi:5-formyltetrahydrofolate cyclo-ligase
MISKSAIRDQGKETRLSLGGSARLVLDTQVANRAQEVLNWEDYENVMIYLPITKQREIDTWQLIRWVWSNHPSVSIFVPRVNGDEVEAVQITPLSTYETSPKGITEPVEGDVLGSDESLDLVICALLGFDSRGYRVGYGGGYYDRFFAEFPKARRVGLAYENLFVEEKIEAEAHDIRLHEVITPERIISF